MRKITFFLTLMVAMVTTAMAQSYKLTETRLSSSDLNSKTEPTLIAIKNLSRTNSYWFVGNTAGAPYSAAEFSNDAVFVWEPVVEGVSGVAYSLKKLDGTYMTSTSPTTFVEDKNAAAPFKTTNPTTSGSGETYFNGDGDTMYDDESLFVRFVTGDKWINVQNGDTGIPVYNNGLGGWTLHNVYLVEESDGTEQPTPDPELPEVVIPSFKQTLADVTAKEVAEYPEGVATAKEAESAGEGCTTGVVKRALQNVNVTVPCEMTVNFQYTGGVHKLVLLGVDLVDAEGAVVAQDYHYGFTGGAAKDNTYTLDGTALAAGNYTLRYFFCHKGNDHEVGNQTADITVNGAESVVTLPEGVVADPSELKATAVYTIVPQDENRGVIYAAAESTHLTTTALANANPSDANQQFMFVENEGKTYLYSVGAGKFVNDEGQYLNLTAEPDHFVTVEKGTAAGYMFINMNGADKINVSTGWQHGTVANWNDADAGNNLRVTYVDEASQATLDALDAIFNPTPVEPEPVTFEIYALDDNMNPSPLEGTVNKLGFVVFAASDNNAVLAEAADAPKVGIFDPAMGGLVAEASGIMFGDLLGNGMQLVAVQFDGFATPGTYMVYAPAGAFTVNGQPSEEIISAEFTIPAPTVKVFEVESVTPANGAEVEAINKIEIKFTEDIILQQNPATWDFYTVNLVDENNNVIELTTSDDANIWSKAVFTPAEPITAAGTYTLDLSQIKLNGGVCEGSYTWTIAEPVVAEGELVLDLTAEQIGTTYPYQLSDEDAAKVFALNDITVAVKFNTAGLGGRKALFATSDPTKAVNTDAMGTNSYYVAYGMNNADLGYLASWKAGDRYTAGNSIIPADTEGNVAVFVINPTINNFRSYLNGQNIADRNFGAYEIATPAMVKADYADANIYIGGGMNASGAGEVFDGQIVGVKVFNGALSAEEIAAISFESAPVEPELGALEATKVTRNPAESDWDPSKSYYLQGVKLDFAEAVKKADGVTEFGCIYDANDEVVAVINKILGANGTAMYATPYVATKITTAGTYKVVVYPGVILSADGAKEYKGGEFEFVVAKKPATLIPSAEDGLFYNASFTSVEEFKTQQIIVSGADEVTVSEDVKITMTSGENVYTAAVTVEDKDGNKVINIVFPDEDYAAGRYTINIPAGAFLVDGEANAEYYPSNFTYNKPQLNVTKDWTSWEALFTEKYMMPREVVIAINNAEAVTVAEGMVATLTVGETTYNSTVLFTNEENNYWISFKFAEIEAINEDGDADFVKGEYTFTVPAGLYTVNGEANVEETRVFTYGDAVVEEFSVTSVSPAVGDVTELNRIEIAFSNNTKPEQLVLTNGDERFFFVAKDGAYVAVDPLKDYAEITITEPGTYTLDLSEIEGLTGDKVFSWTIAGSTPGIEADKFYRIKSTTVGNYMAIRDENANTHGHVYGADFNADDKDQIFSFIPVEGEENNYYVVSLAGKYISEQGTGYGWNVNYTEDASQAFKLTFVPVEGAELQYIIKCYNSSKFGEYYFKYEYVGASGKYHPYSDAAESAAEVWALEEATAPAPAPEPLEIVGYTPAEAVEKLDVITVTFSDEIEGTFDVMAMTQIYLGSKGNGCSYAVDGNVLTITPFNAITAAGKYALNIPAGLITRKATGEDVTMSGEIEFEVKEAPAPATFAVEAGLFPTPQGDVTEIKGIRVEANLGATLYDLPTEWTLTNEAGDEYVMNIQWLYDYETVLIMVDPITEAGTYTLTIPAGSLKTEDGKECEAATFSWTIEETITEGIDSVDAEAENAVIYDLTGRKIEKITKAGIYIINGVKKVVK